MIITAKEFREYFYNEFTYIDEWSKNNTYFIDDVCYKIVNERQLFYQLLEDDNKEEPASNDKWSRLTDRFEIANYTTDNDIERQIKLASNKNVFYAEVFNTEQKDNDLSEQQIALLYLTAHFLTLYKQNIQNSGRQQQVTASQSVGDVSESFALPQESQNLRTAQYMSTSYGIIYYNMMRPLARVKSTRIFEGRTTDD